MAILAGAAAAIYDVTAAWADNKLQVLFNLRKKGSKLCR